MHVSVEHFDGKYPSFNVNIASREGKEPFISIKGCKIMDGSKGPFVSWPATKNQNTGKYWNHVWANEEFAAHVMNLANKAAQEAKRPSRQAPADDLDPPF